MARGPDHPTIRPTCSGVGGQHRSRPGQVRHPLASAHEGGADLPANGKPEGGSTLARARRSRAPFAISASRSMTRSRSPRRSTSDLTRYPDQRTWSATAYPSPIADRSRTGAHDRAFIDQHVLGYDAFMARADDWSLEKAADALQLHSEREGEQYVCARSRRDMEVRLFSDLGAQGIDDNEFSTFPQALADLAYQMQVGDRRVVAPDDQLGVLGRLGADARDQAVSAGPSLAAHRSARRMRYQNR